MARRIGEPFPLPLFCPECFEPLGPDNAMLYPTDVNESGVGCESCWVNPLCPGGCNGVHGAPVPRGARANLRRYSVPGTWECPTTGESFRIYPGENTEERWNDPDEWEPDRWNQGTYLNPDRTEWYESENDWHEDMGHEYCSECDRYFEDYNDLDDHYYSVHAEPDYDDDEYYGEQEYRTGQAIGQWQSDAEYYNPVTEEVSATQQPGFIPLPVPVDRVGVAS